MRTGEFRQNDTSTIRSSKNLPRMGTASITKLNQSAFSPIGLKRFYRRIRFINISITPAPTTIKKKISSRVDSIILEIMWE